MGITGNKPRMRLEMMPNAILIDQPTEIGKVRMPPRLFESL